MASDARIEVAAEAVSRRRRESSMRLLFRTKPLGVFGLIVVVFMIVVAVIGLFWVPKDPLEINARDLFRGPSLDFPFGADEQGRDLLSRLMTGAQFSLYIAFVSVFIGNSVGFLIGLVSAYFGGKTDLILQRFVDTYMAIPAIIMVLALVTAKPATTYFPPPFDSPLNDVVIAIGIFQIAATSRVIRSVALSEAAREYVDAAKAIGASDLRIMFKHVAPQTLAPLIILVTAGLGTAILIEASLSFLGFGVPPPNPTWGNMLSGPTTFNVEKSPYMAIFPGVALTMTVLAFNLLGDSLRDVFDPRLRR